MTIADPKHYAKVNHDDEPEALTIKDLIQALQALRGDDDETLQKRAKYEAEAHARLQRKENETHPGISVYNPQGERDHPHPDLKCKIFWCGYPEQKETLTGEEIALLNQLDEPGEFLFHKTDGSVEKAIVSGEKDARGQWVRLLINFPCQGDNRHNLPTKVALLREILKQTTPEDDLRAELARLRALVGAA